jgi:hypothetical protein
VDDASGSHPEAGGERLEGGYVFEVTDTGAGILKDSLEKKDMGAPRTENSPELREPEFISGERAECSCPP